MPKKHRKKHVASKDFVSVKKAATIIILSLFFSAVIASIAFVSYTLGLEEASNQEASEIVPKIPVSDTLHERLKQTLEEAKHAVDVSHNTTSELVKKSKDALVIKPIEPITPKEIIFNISNKPKLAIILDDVSFEHEVSAVKALKIKVNFSFFPPSPAHPSTPEMAQKEPFYMVHLPLEAANFHQEEPNTLRVDDSFFVIKRRLQTIKERFPRLHYMNNHTGSTFTSDEKAVKRLLKATRSLGLEMIDSRTTAETKMPEVYKKQHIPLLSRNVFLDHEPGLDYICGQIDKAVAYAQKHGHAIAIGHPRTTTIKALKHCKERFNAVELIYINQL